MAEFAYLAGCKLKTRIGEDGIERWCEVCHIVDTPTGPQLYIFKVTLHILTAVKRVVVVSRTRNSDPVTILDRPVKPPREFTALLSAEAAIAGYILRLDK